MIGTIDKTKVKMALTEVDAILNELSIQEYNKIPDEVIDFIDENKDINYKWEYDYDKSLENQNLSEYTIEILAYINNEYLLDDEQKKLMEEIFELNDKKEKSNIATAPITAFKDANDLFEHKEKSEKQENNEEIINNNKLPIAINNKENVFTRILKAIKNFFHIKSK